MTLINKLVAGVLLAALAVPQGAVAGIQLQGTRFIYLSDAREITVDLQNDADRAALVQSWLDSGDASAEPGVEQLPFVVLPPLVRVEPRTGQTLRIAYTGQGLPEDQESVFWLNVLDVPPRVENSEDRNVMRLAYRTRVKLFFRPDGLPGTLQDAAENISWTLESVGEGYALRAHNDGAFHVSFRDITLRADGHDYHSTDSGMVGPHDTADFVMEGLSIPVASGEVTGYWLNDYGASMEQHYPL
ncbi:fimbrial chaperone [Halomonas cupida]|uniref:Chaperone protein EcpD n=1 Tax=Halomonas cupida TaxID=44933 RepID=A0A1M7GEQ6_9GAMM|nr:fimbria/pilus periplasmic chaperone [Halomonas cupida]GEN23772.1 fimbrial chaperone [Halomonas cupida]SHM14605.1 chaperone protein EcpD [Halomonas cupida]